MTTIDDGEKPEFILVDDLWQKNECVNLPPLDGDRDQRSLAGLSIVFRPELSVRREAVWMAMLHAIRLLSSGVQPLVLWLCACEIGPANRIFRHRKLWKNIERNGIKIPSSDRTGEFESEQSDGSVAFFGAAKVSLAEAEESRDLIGPASRSFLVLMPNGSTPDVSALMGSGWRRGLSEFVELRNIAIVVTRQRGVLLRPFGEFDDPEAGVDCLIHPSLLSSLKEALPEGTRTER